MTKYGKKIAEVVLSSQEHLTAEQIYQTMRQAGERVSIATVYNNLKTLVAEGVLRKITLDGSADLFDKPTRHQHLICARCGKLMDIELRDLTGIFEEDAGTEVLSYDIRISCICKSCREEMKKNPDRK